MLKINTMEEKIKILFLALLLAAALMLASFFAGWSFRGNHDRKDEAKPVPDTTWFTITEEIHVPSPPDTVTRTEYKNVPVPFYIKGDTDTIVDSVLVTLPFERHMARLDSVAEVWYSGYDAKIDSAIIYKRSITEIITKPTVIETTRCPILTLDVGIGNHEWKGLDPYVFARATINADKWKIEPYVGYTYSKQPMFGVSVSRSFTLIK